MSLEQVHNYNKSLKPSWMPIVSVLSNTKFSTTNNNNKYY